jgi:hypothetical protein
VKRLRVSTIDRNDLGGPPSERGSAIEAFNDGVPEASSSPPATDGLGAELERVCRTAVRELHLLGAAVSLMSSAGSEAGAAVSDQPTRRLEEMQFDLAEGPGRDAFRAGHPVLTSDMEEAFARWPAFAAAAREVGVGAAYAFPLQVGASRFGVLSLYVDRPRSLDRAELRACLDLAEAATEALVGGPRRTVGAHRPDLSGALRFRTEVYQAQGMVMVDLGIDLATALARMRAHAFASDTDLDQLARDIISGRARLENGDEPDPTPADLG